MNNQNAQHLLEQVSVISNKYKDIAKITGENFNIFSVLRMQNDEVGLHSRFIGELLNPKGSHDQSGLFLKLFIQEIGLRNEYTESQINNASVLIEENIGGISEDYETGGRIDLVIKFPDSKREIVIENKIWAVDQPKQLWRYRQQYPNAYLVYLTPFVKEPSKESLKNIALNQIICITYKTHIINWINNCVKESVNLPLIREVLNHYLNTINAITNQSNNHAMSQDIIKIILNSKENIDAALNLEKNQDQWKDQLITQFFQRISQKLSEHNIKQHEFHIKYSEKYNWINFTSDISEKLNIGLSYAPQDTNFKSSIIGFFWLDKTKQNKEIIIKLSGNGYKNNDNYAGFKLDNEHPNWNEEYFFKILDRSLDEEFIQKFLNLSHQIEHILENH